MKTIFIILLAALAGMICSCGGGKYLSREQLTTERESCVTYYTHRSVGFPFSTRFYELRDSAANSVHGSDERTVAIIYSRINGKRVKDSTDHLSAAAFREFSNELDTDFDIANGGRK